tara:strand:- start:3982 stop:4716 length:735 start_codon:yes stop_codon:yes gene_type:complete
MEIGQKERIETYFRNLLRVHYGQARLAAPSSCDELYELALPDTYRDLEALAKHTGCERVLHKSTDFNLVVNKSSLPTGTPIHKDITTRVAVPRPDSLDIQISTSTPRTDWDAGTSRYSSTNIDNSLWIDAENREKWATWAYNVYAARGKANDQGALVYKLVGQCSSFGQVQRLIPEVFTLLPERFAVGADGYKRKPRLPESLTHYEGVAVYKNELTDLQQSLSIAALLKSSVDEALTSTTPDIL